MIVRPEPPVPVVKAAQATATTIAIPPGIQPKRASKQRSSRAEDWPAASTKPAVVRSGMAGMVGDAMRR